MKTVASFIHICPNFETFLKLLAAPLHSTKIVGRPLSGQKLARSLNDLQVIPRWNVWEIFACGPAYFKFGGGGNPDSRSQPSLP